MGVFGVDIKELRDFSRRYREGKKALPSPISTATGVFTADIERRKTIATADMCLSSLNKDDCIVQRRLNFMREYSQPRK